MAEETPIIEIRRVRVEYTVNGPPWQKAPATPDIEDLARAVRKELIKTGFRNPDIFGGRA